MARSMPVCRRRQWSDERNIFLSTMPATRRDRMRRACRRRRLGGAVRLRRAVCRRAARAGSGIRCELSVRARDQRSDHRRPAVFAVRDFALAGAAAARERISVHGGGGDRPRPDLSRPVRARRAVRCGPADHGLALHDLARRISAAGARLCAAEGKRNGAEDTGLDRRGRSLRASSRSASRWPRSPGSSPPSTTCCRSC